MIHSNKILVWTQYKNKQNVSRCISGNFAGIIIISWSDKLCGRKHKISTHAQNIGNMLKVYSITKHLYEKKGHNSKKATMNYKRHKSEKKDDI